MPRNTRPPPVAVTALIGANARACRRSAGLTLLNVAARADLTESMLSKIENGKACPSVRSLVQLARALGVEVGTLFRDTAIDRVAA